MDFVTVEIGCPIPSCVSSLIAEHPKLKTNSNIIVHSAAISFIQIPFEKAPLDQSVLIQESGVNGSFELADFSLFAL